MKKCPHCGADIAENASFCLYCMSSLNDKEVIPHKVPSKKRKHFILLFVILFVLLSAGLLTIFISGDDHNQDLTSTPDSTALTVFSPEITDSEEENILPTLEASNEADTTPSVSVSPANTSEPEITPSKAPQNTMAPGVTPTLKPTATVTPKPTLAPTPAKAPDIVAPASADYGWNYRAAKSSDYDQSRNGVSPENAIVLTGFENSPSGAMLIVPYTINGKKVVAVDMANPTGKSFKDATHYIIYFPPSLTHITKGSLAGCNNLRTLGFASNYVYLDPAGMPEATNDEFEIYCSDSCICGYNGKTFKEYCTSPGTNQYLATYQKWNGSKLYGN